jgi:hypothetical protein
VRGDHLCFWLLDKINEGYIEEPKMIDLWWKMRLS